MDEGVATWVDVAMMRGEEGCTVFLFLMAWFLSICSNSNTINNNYTLRVTELVMGGKMGSNRHVTGMSQSHIYKVLSNLAT